MLDQLLDDADKGQPIRPVAVPGSAAQV